MTPKYPWNHQGIETCDERKAAAPAQAQHSPLPWHRATTNEGECFAITSDMGRICTINQTLGGVQGKAMRNANGRLIVRACNNAQRLADVLKELLNVYTLPIQFITNSQRIRRSQRAVKEAREALAQWEKDNQ